MKKWFTTAAALLLAGSLHAQAPTASGEIKNLDMPPMTMVFRVSDPKLLEGLAVGQRIGFTAERINGQYTVTSVTKAP